MGASGDPTTAAMELSLDPDIYNTAVLTDIGLQDARPADTVGVVSVTLDQAARSNRASFLRVTCYQGSSFDTATEVRNIEIICEQSKVLAALTSLIDKTVTLGIGATAKAWKIGRVR